MSMQLVRKLSGPNCGSNLRAGDALCVVLSLSREVNFI